MGKIVFDVSMSLDGFIAGANPRVEEGWGGLGEGGERLHDWAFQSEEPRNQEVSAWYSTVGAVIMGRTTYDLSILNWGSDGPTGADRIPTVIVSHSVPEDVPQDGVYTFASGVEAAYEAAKRLAGDKDIYTTGANVAQQLLRLGIIDEIAVHLVPVIFGSGTRLFEGFDSQHISLEIIETIETKDAIHLRFRVVK
jgi:dihydrofolate reductase